MNKVVRIIVSGMFAFFIYFPWVVALPQFIYFLGGLCFLASFQAILFFRKLKAPWNIAHLATPLMIGIFLIVYAAQF
ncbi:MAG TPA: hypothetical protein DDY49_10045 [Paenibacillaceae bacterium]|nr:hypothetical protein [Paenibacillaceae bacterium]